MPVTKLRPGFCRIVSRDVSHVIDTSKEINTIRIKARVVSKRKRFPLSYLFGGSLSVQAANFLGR